MYIIKKKTIISLREKKFFFMIYKKLALTFSELKKLKLFSEHCRVLSKLSIFFINDASLAGFYR